MLPTVRNEIISKINSFATNSNNSYSIEESINDFWKNNKNTIKEYVIMNKFSDEDFSVITKAVDKICDELLFVFVDYKTIDDIYKDILQSYIALALQHKVHIEKYLYKYFDTESEYFKKIKVLSLIRLYDWPFENLKYLFWDICSFILSTDINDTENIEERCNIVKEYLEMIKFDPEISWLWVNHLLEMYWSKKCCNVLLSNKWFNRRIHEDSWLENKTTLTTTELINEISGTLNKIKDYWLRLPDNDSLNNCIKPLIEEYSNIEKEYLNELNIIDSISEEDWPNQCVVTYFWSYENIMEEVKNRENMMSDLVGDFKYDSILIDFKWADFKWVDLWEQESCIDKLKKSNPSYKFINWKDRKYRLDSEISNLVDLEFDLEAKWNEILNKIITFCYNRDKQGKTWNKKPYWSYSESIEEDSNKLEEAQNIIWEMKEKLKEYENINLEKDEKIMSLLKRNAELEKNAHEEEKINLEKNDLRQYYRITVVWWADKANKKFNNMLKEKSVVDRLELDFWLKSSQFELKWDYSKQKDRNFTKQIKDELDLGNTNFIIVLQCDHETWFRNLMESPEYSSRITEFAEIEEDWRSKFTGQTFSVDRFYHYLSRAISKYEVSQKNNSIWL